MTLRDTAADLEWIRIDRVVGRGGGDRGEAGRPSGQQQGNRRHRSQHPLGCAHRRSPGPRIEGGNGLPGWNHATSAGTPLTVGWRTTGDPSRHSRDHLPPGVALFQVGDRCGDLGERIAPVDLRAHLAGLNQLRKELQILGGYVRRTMAMSLPPRSETPISFATLVNPVTAALPPSASARLRSGTDRFPTVSRMRS